MAKIIFIRHAKSSWKFKNLNDIDRPLSPKGIRTLSAQLEKHQKEIPVPSIVLSSPAVRAAHTAILTCHFLKIPPESIKIKPGLYNSSVLAIIKLIEAEIGPTIKTILIVGHDPLLSETINYICNTDYQKIPTSGIFEVEVNLKNRRIKKGSGKIKKSWLPTI